MALRSHHVRRIAVKCREKKLLAGCRFSLAASGEKEGKYDCQECDERQREIRNCHNRQEVAWDVVVGRDEWLKTPNDLRPVLKIDDAKFYQCPVSIITPKTWSIIELVNETTDAECNIRHLPFPGTILDQPEWYRAAVKIVRSERARHRQEEAEKLRNR